MKFNKLQIIGLLLLVSLLASPVIAASETLDIFGTNSSNAQTNITKSGNQSINVSAWSVGNGIKTLTINVTNTTDIFTITLHNITIGRVSEVKFNGSSVIATQADTTGSIVFAQVQTTGNRTYTIQPAVNLGGQNTTWSWTWSYPFILGSNITSLFVPFQNAVSDLDMNGKNITNVTEFRVTTVNTTVLNATNIAGNGSGISQINASNLTGSLPAINGSALFGLNMSNQTRCTGNLTCTYQANGSVSLDAANNITAIFNQVLNTSTVTVGMNANKTIELTATGGATHNFYNYSNISIASNISDFSTYNETDPNSEISFTPTNISVNSVTDTASRMTVGINSTGNFSINFTYAYSTMSGGTIHGLVFMSDINGSYSVSPFNGIGLMVVPGAIYLQKVLNGVPVDGSTIAIDANTKYYGTFVRLDSSLTLSLFTDSARTTHKAGSPVTWGSGISTRFTNFSAVNNRVYNAGTKAYFLADVSLNTADKDKEFNTQYINGNNVIILTAIANMSISTGNGYAAMQCLNGTNALSGKVGIFSSVQGYNSQMQLTCIVPANSPYAINNSQGSGNVELVDWREVTI